MSIGRKQSIIPFSVISRKTEIVIQFFKVIYLAICIEVQKTRWHIRAVLDRQKTRLSLRSSNNPKRKLQSEEEPELDADGRLIIQEDETALKRSMPTEADLDARSHAGSNRSVNSRKAEKRRKTTESGWAYTSSE
nr:hypothetical protein [Tanacetum cinerariifolium]